MFGGPSNSNIQHCNIHNSNDDQESELFQPLLKETTANIPIQSKESQCDGRFSFSNSQGPSWKETFISETDYGGARRSLMGGYMTESFVHNSVKSNENSALSLHSNWIALQRDNRGASLEIKHRQTRPDSLDFLSVSAPTHSSISNYRRSIEQQQINKSHHHICSPVSRTAYLEERPSDSSQQIQISEQEEEFEPPLKNNHDFYRVQTDQKIQESPQKKKLPLSEYSREFVIGVINTIVTLPAMMSFAVIIFNDPFYDDKLPNLVKLVFLASGLIQLIFLFFSSLRFAIGQVQDVGLIFLSAMSTAVAHSLWWSVPPEERTEELSQKVMGTALVSTAVSTALVGLLLIGIAKLKLASLVQFVPVPVVGGYLGYVGYFCIVAGVSLATGIIFKGVEDWVQIISVDKFLMLVPTIFSALACFYISRRVRSPIALPLLLILLPVVFYLVLLAVPGWDLGVAQKNGWSPPPVPSGDFIDVYRLYNLYPFKWSNIAWMTVLKQFPTFVALFVVVSFGSCMDIAAIQQELPKELDYNQELVTVGIANFLTGILGAGFTGSYIFSQTIFTMRTGVKTVINAAVIAAAEILLFLIPGSIIQWFPNFYLGALMVWFGAEISYDWLIASYKKCTRVEFGLLVFTFVLIMVFSEFFPVEGLEIGIFVGILAATLHFAYSYAKVQSVAINVVSNRSSQVRTFRRRMILDLIGGSNMVALQLKGYIFFGSSVTVTQKVKEISQVLHEDLQPDQVQKVAEELEVSSVLCSQAIHNSPRFLILDFRGVTGLDVTAARSFATLHSSISVMGVQLVLTHLPKNRPSIQKLLQAYKVISKSSIESNINDNMNSRNNNNNKNIIEVNISTNPTDSTPSQDSAVESLEQQENHSFCLHFETLEEGLKYCEEKLLEEAVQLKLCEKSVEHMELQEILRTNCEAPKLLVPPQLCDYEFLANQLSQLMSIVALQQDEVVYDIGQMSHEVYLIRSGRVKLQFDFNYAPQFSEVLSRDSADGQLGELLLGAGNFIGDLDFVLSRPRKSRAVCQTNVTLFCLTDETLQMMATNTPSLLILLQGILLRGIGSGADNAIQAVGKGGVES